MLAVAITLLFAIPMCFVEFVRPAVARAPRAWWWTRAIAFNVVQAGAVFAGAVTWDRWFDGRSLLDAASLGTLGSAALGYLVVTFVYYWWHRARHHSPFLWRWLHQLHHSPARIEILTSFYKHPFEIVANGILTAAILELLLGLAPEAAAISVVLTGVAELFYHWNIRTPYWLGYLIQRPESHRVHHESGKHRSNYSDLPLWDIFFGTFHNPRETISKCGFSAERELMLIPMLTGRDVHALRVHPERKKV